MDTAEWTHCEEGICLVTSAGTVISLEEGNEKNNILINIYSELCSSSSLQIVDEIRIRLSNLSPEFEVCNNRLLLYTI